MENVICFKTKYGWIHIKEFHNKIISVSFGKAKESNPSLELHKLKKNILNYFLGKKIKCKFSLRLTGSKLQKKIWRELQKIPYGQTRSYGDIAKSIENVSQGKPSFLDRAIFFINILAASPIDLITALKNKLINIELNE